MTGVLLLLALQTTATQDLGGFDQSSYMEKRLAEWKPAETYIRPTGAPQSDAQSLVGEWHVGGGFESTTVTFGGPNAGVFPVTFRTGGCLGMWTLKRTATLKDGVVMLNKAVEKYCGEPYDRYFFVKKGEVLWLVPTGTTERGKELFEQSKYGSAETWFEYFSLQKNPIRVG